MYMATVAQVRRDPGWNGAEYQCGGEDRDDGSGS